MYSAEVIEFWFEEIPEEKWWEKDELFDSHIRERFGSLHQAAINGEFFAERESAYGRLAEIILLDQFSRNIYRGTPGAFSADTIALVLSQEAIRVGAQKGMTNDERAFLYMPFMHSESIKIHETSMKLFSEPGLEGYLEYEIAHKNILERFGRYPHRNEALNRETTPEEREFIVNNSDF